MGTYVIEGVELDNKVKMVLGDRQQPPRSQKLTERKVARIQSGTLRTVL